MKNIPPRAELSLATSHWDNILAYYSLTCCFSTFFLGNGRLLFKSAWNQKKQWINFPNRHYYLNKTMKFIYSTCPLYSFAVWYYHKYPCNALAEKRKELNPLFGYQIIQRILEKIRRMQRNIIFQFKQLGLTLLRIRLTICLHTVLCRRRTKFEMIWKSTRKMSSIRKSKYEAIYLSEKWRIERNGNTQL